MISIDAKSSDKRIIISMISKTLRNIWERRMFGTSGIPST